jgi:hypothetical protein
MQEEEKEEIVDALQEELRSFFAWIINEIGLEYYIDDPNHPSESLEEEARKAFSRRSRSKKLHVWERDWHSFSHQENHPSIYKLFEAEDLEIVHYLEDLPCEHLRQLEIQGEQSSCSTTVEKKYEESFGVLLASQTLGWMYRMDFCDVCGLIEVWSMAYHPEEISFFSEDR